MADWAKIALKTGLIAVVMTALWAVFTQITVPTLDFSLIFSGFGTAMAIFAYWCPAFTLIWQTTLAMLLVLVALWTFRYAMVAIRWLFKVNE